jgi:SAM-dependent methyltransferase
MSQDPGALKESIRLYYAEFGRDVAALVATELVDKGGFELLLPKLGLIDPLDNSARYHALHAFLKTKGPDALLRKISGLGEDFKIQSADTRSVTSENDRRLTDMALRDARVKKERAAATGAPSGIDPILPPQRGALEPKYPGGYPTPMNPISATPAVQPGAASTPIQPAAANTPIQPGATATPMQPGAAQTPAQASVKVALQTVLPTPGIAPTAPGMPQQWPVLFSGPLRTGTPPLTGYVHEHARVGFIETLRPERHMARSRTPQWHRATHRRRSSWRCGIDFQESSLWQGSPLQDRAPQGLAHEGIYQARRFQAVSTPPVGAWEPEQYHRFQAERRLPFDDLLAMVERKTDMRVVDLGCGTGELTRELHVTLDAAETLGIDNSESMLAKTRGLNDAGLVFRHGDLAQFEIDRPCDLLFSNAALQWVDDHPALLARLCKKIAAGRSTRRPDSLEPRSPVAHACGGVGRYRAIRSRDGRPRPPISCARAGGIRDDPASMWDDFDSLDAARVHPLSAESRERG